MQHAAHKALLNDSARSTHLVSEGHGDVAVIGTERLVKAIAALVSTARQDKP